MYELDLTRITRRPIYPLGEKFAGMSPDGREIGFTNAYMVLNGKPFFGVSGEMHYARVTPDQWEDAVVKMKCGGINILSTYAFWIVHEEEEGVFRFDGCRDLRRFLEICEAHGMMVIMRVGPFCHGEMRNGGLPDWLYGKPYDVRENNPGFLAVVRRYFRALHGQMDGHYFRQGGCIVAAQLDNEYRHSAAPWEITTGISNERFGVGGSGEDYLLALKKIMQEEGIVTPFYTCTAWGGAIAPIDEALPLWSGYSYQPWLFYDRTGDHPATPETLYRDCHSNEAAATTGMDSPYPPESMPYACCEMMGGMMCSYHYRFQMDMRAVDAMANAKLGSGCSLLGYYMYKGGTTPTGRRTPYLNESQISKRSYDYQAAVGEFGQIRESYGRLKAIHMLCETFAELLPETQTALPEHMLSVQPDDPEPLRWCVREKDGAGFLFINNFQDHAKMRDRTDETVLLHTAKGDVVFRFGIAEGENAILPFNLPLDDDTLVWATAQPLKRIGNPWFFFAPDGMAPQYCLRTGGSEITLTPDENGVARAGKWTFVTLTREESLGFHVFSIRGRETAFLSDRPLLLNGETLSVETETGCATVLAWPEDALSIPETAEIIEKGPFRGCRIGTLTPPLPVELRQTGTGRYTVQLPPDILQGHKQTLLRIRYSGDIGHAFLRNEMISDNFANGAPWDVRVDCHTEALRSEPLTIYITPRNEKVTFDRCADEEQPLTAELIRIHEFKIH